MRCGRFFSIAVVVAGLSLVAVPGAAYAGELDSGSLREDWAEATFQAWFEAGRINVEVTNLTDTGKDGKCVYVEAKADIRNAVVGIEPHDPDTTVVRVCGTGESGSGSASWDIGLFNEVDNVEFKMCKKGWAQDPCVKSFVYPEA